MFFEKTPFDETLLTTFGLIRYLVAITNLYAVVQTWDFANRAVKSRTKVLKRRSDLCMAQMPI